MTECSKFDEVMDELLTGKDGTTIANFNGGSLKGFADHQDVFWDDLLQYLQNENQKEPFEGAYGIRQSMFPPGTDVQSVIKYINDNADLIDAFLDRCLKSESASDFLSHWNQGFEKHFKSIVITLLATAKLITQILLLMMFLTQMRAITLTVTSG